MNERFWLKELVFKLLGKLKELKMIFAQHYTDYYYYSSKQVHF